MWRVADSRGYSDETGGTAIMAVTKRTRYEVLRRDNYTCRYCGGRAPDVALTVDHVVPAALGGIDDPGNLVAACRDCNAGKSSSHPDDPLVAQVDEDALRWAAAVKLAARTMASKRQALADQVQPFEEAWQAWLPSYRLADRRWTLPHNWAEVVASYLDAGLDIDTLIDAARVALHARAADDRFRYFLGVARNRLIELHQLARLAVDHELV